MARHQWFGRLRLSAATQLETAKPQAVPFLIFFLAVMGVRGEGYQFPPEVRGDLVARLEVRVAEAAEAATGVVTLTVTVEGGENLEVAPARLDDPTDAWRARCASSWSLDAHASAAGRVTWSQSFQLRQAKPGFPNLPAVTVRFRAGPAAAWEEATWVNILKEPRKAPPPEPVPLEETTRPLWPLVVVGVIGGLIAAVWLRRRPRPTSARSPEEQAVLELDAVERADLTPAELHRRLSEVVRGYLAERWQLPALRQTTAEFVEAYGSQVPGVAREALADFLQRCDLAKFAPVELAARECQVSVTLARSILRACGEESKSTVS